MFLVGHWTAYLTSSKSNKQEFDAFVNNIIRIPKVIDKIVSTYKKNITEKDTIG